jgi:aspartyl-tRNA(Asn)/glutamyl-tRNA(Gln) amidotransferase subunit B
MSAGRYEPIVGLEVHAQLLTDSKMFCGCSTQFGAPPNTQVCPVCLGLPGSLPVVNERAVEFAVMMGLATHCTVHRRSVFARKNYFYPDCPKNYQISQYEEPLCTDGYITLDSGKRVGIVRIHLEEDAGKLVHDDEGRYSYVDMNRCGVPLIEIVSAPDIRSPREASEYLQKLRSILRYLRICDGNMEEGSLRCDVNVSLRERGSETFGTKTELKNLNSFKAVEQAIAFEIDRQRRKLDAGEPIQQETLLWDAKRGTAEIMRTKEEAQDYRYFPEPDLPILEVSDELLERARRQLPELPDARKERLVEEYGIPPYDAGVLTASREVADYFEAMARALGDGKTASNWVMGEVLRELKERKIGIEDFGIAPEALAELAAMAKKGRVNMPTAKEIFREMLETGRDAETIVKERGLEQISEAGALEGVVAHVVEKHPDEVRRYLAGKVQLIQFFVGQVMKATRGKANPKLARELLEKALEAKR